MFKIVIHTAVAAPLKVHLFAPCLYTRPGAHSMSGYAGAVSGRLFKCFMGGGLLPHCLVLLIVPWHMIRYGVWCGTSWCCRKRGCHGCPVGLGIWHPIGLMGAPPLGGRLLIVPWYLIWYGGWCGTSWCCRKSCCHGCLVSLCSRHPVGFMGAPPLGGRLLPSLPAVADCSLAPD
jgi:hypothetical protein